MKIRMTETYLIEADSIEELEEQYADDHLESCNSFIDFESVSFKEVKEYEKMQEVIIPLKDYTELIRKAYAFDIIKAKESNRDYYTDFEKAIFGIEDKAPVPEEDDF